MTIDLDIGKIVSMVDGSKTHIVSAVGIALILAHHFWHLDVPGMTYDDAQWLSQIYTLVMVMCGRSALKKIEPSNPPAGGQGTP